ncbi:FAD-dependent thymidylate synthase [Sporosarcina trichiuri]|uniref:FAD-dependent thymidylate synthase n=1 Tax=Sporosarcina trichiuri TaxID=3056445 RepID=UPI0025B32740|nr:FAD-dependent thymidylate synthase [Sporosarcina sp. 0.2-SM1T-5]WJY27431.1 FAD-dependent thymidylate synthase [Sporosarcina sp. 0.2-SM1T-5]WJY27451.1 FAD-dependent thymidylate synthase [Sporosarcina sp. 0.2-SM1T-5]
MIQVLDRGYVRLENKMGSDLTIVNSARVSYDKKSEELTEKDKGLIRFLIREGHTSPLRHAMMTFEIYAPLMVARQWWKYVVGSDHTMDSWNESSRRYLSEDEHFYIPGSHEWRGKPANSKQGSAGPVDTILGISLTDNLLRHIDSSMELYRMALEDGVAPEQARLFLPAYGMYVRWYWTASLQAVLHFLDQRLEHDAQKEIQLYAEAVEQYVTREFPEVYQAWRDQR